MSQVQILSPRPLISKHFLFGIALWVTSSCGSGSQIGSQHGQPTSSWALPERTQQLTGCLYTLAGKRHRSLSQMRPVAAGGISDHPRECFGERNHFVPVRDQAPLALDAEIPARHPPPRAMPGSPIFRSRARTPQSYQATEDNAPGGLQPAYWLLDAAVHLKSDDRHLDLAVIGRDLTNTYYMVTSVIRKWQQQSVCWLFQSPARGDPGSHIPFLGWRNGTSLKRSAPRRT